MRWVTKLARLVYHGVPYRGRFATWIARQVALAAVVAVPATGFVLLVLAATQLGVPFWQLWLLLAVGLLVRWFLLAVGQPAAAPPQAGSLPAAELPSSSYPLADRWERRLSITDGDAAWYSTVVRDRMVPVVSERMRRRHGFTLATDPARAQHLLGEPLYHFLTGRLDRTPSPAELRWLVSRMEEI